MTGKMSQKGQDSHREPLLTSRQVLVGKLCLEKKNEGNGGKWDRKRRWEKRKGGYRKMDNGDRGKKEGRRKEKKEQDTIGRDEGRRKWDFKNSNHSFGCINESCMPFKDAKDSPSAPFSFDLHYIDKQCFSIDLKGSDACLC